MIITSELEFFLIISCATTWLLVVFAYFTASKVDDLEERIKQLEQKK